MEEAEAALEVDVQANVIQRVLVQQAIVERLIVS